MSENIEQRILLRRVSIQLWEKLWKHFNDRNVSAKTKTVFNWGETGECDQIVLIFGLLCNGLSILWPCLGSKCLKL